MEVSNVDPDDESLTKICMLANHVNMLMYDFNVPYGNTVVGQYKIVELQSICLSLWQAIILSLDVKANTKVHKVMHHVSDQLKDLVA